jgi:predicted amidohydrolase
MKTVLAVAQMSSHDDKNKNLKEIECLAKDAKKAGAILLSLPENCVFMGRNTESKKAAESLDGQSISHLKSIARENGIWLSIGGFQELILNSDKIYNTHIVLDERGSLVAFYRKIHLFSALLPTKELYAESKLVMPGKEFQTFQGPSFIGGLSICYDLRFPYLFWALRKRGAQVLFVPAAFTATTGIAHWEVLLRARAIETQSYVVAAAQIGENVSGRFTYGHAMIIDPWGLVLAECGEKDRLAIAEIDIALVEKLRRDMPIATHRVCLD